MAKLSLSNQQKPLDSIWSWYEDQIDALRDFRNKIVSVVIESSSAVKVNEKFKDLTLDELNDYFKNSEIELEHLVCLDIISATEAILRIDYNERVTKKDKSTVGRTFREFYKTKGSRVSLQDDIIETWKDETGDRAFSDFIGILNYRHWLAHGRYWKPKFGRLYSLEYTYQISEAVFNIISA